MYLKYYTHLKRQSRLSTSNCRLSIQRVYYCFVKERENDAGSFSSPILICLKSNGESLRGVLKHSSLANSQQTFKRNHSAKI